MNQAGSGYGGIYSGGIYQKGHGVGSFLSGLFRCVFPLLKSGSAVVGSELLKSGANIISDIGRNENPEVVIKRRGKETINNLSRIVGEKMFGSGYSGQPNRKRIQSSASSRGVKKGKTGKKTTKKPTKESRKSRKKNNNKSRSKREIFDIFS